MKLLRIIAGCLLLPVGIFAQGDSARSIPVEVYGFKNELRVDSGSACLIDPSKKLDIRDAVRLPFTGSAAVFFQQLRTNPSTADFWLKFGLQNNSDSSLRVYVYCGELDYIDLYFLEPGRAPRQVSGGDLRVRHDGSFIERNFSALPLLLSPRQQGEVYVKIKQRTQEPAFDGIGVYDTFSVYDSFVEQYDGNRYFIIFELLFQGILLCQIVYVFLQWLIIRRKEYKYYFLYLVFIAIYFLSKYESTLGLNLLFTHYPVLGIYLNKPLILIPYFLYFRFVRSFLDLPRYYPVMNRWIIRMEYFLLIYAVADLAYIVITFNLVVERWLYTFILLAIFITAFSFMVYLFGQKRKLINYILGGSLCVGLGNILGLIFTYFEYNLHWNIWFSNFLVFAQAGIVLEIFFFTAGLSYKSHAAELEKIKSQETLIEQLKANELLQAKMQQIRNNIAQDLHDDIGSTLSSISILSDLALKGKGPGPSDKTMHEINDSSILLMEKMDDIVWSINPKNDSLDHLLMRVRHFATTLFEAKDIDYSITIPENIGQLTFPVEYRQHIYLILKEAINNLVKYAEATRASIEVTCNDHALELCIRDNGKGFLAGNGTLGNGMLNMRNRAALMKADLEIHSVPGSGSSVTLRANIG
jgi:signal transduction histidine kinase